MSKKIVNLTNFKTLSNLTLPAPETANGDNTMEKYEIVFSAELEADVNEFVRKWNADAECSKIATATAEKKVGCEQFDPNLIKDITVYLTMNPIEATVITGLLTSIGGNVIYDAIKSVFKAMGYSVNVKKDKWERLSVEHLPLKKKNRTHNV
jgi:hypothetical protein